GASDFYTTPPLWPRALAAGCLPAERRHLRALQAPAARRRLLPGPRGGAGAARPGEGLRLPGVRRLPEPRRTPDALRPAHARAPPRSRQVLRAERARHALRLPPARRRPLVERQAGDRRGLRVVLEARARPGDRRAVRRAAVGPRGWQGLRHRHGL